MRHIVQKGTISANPELGFSVHVEVENLAPASHYFSRFHSGAATSPVGRTKTAPTRGADADAIRFAFASCQHYEYGFYNPHRDMAAQDLDAVLFLGDYIYEYHLQAPVRRHQLAQLITLDDYRHQHAQYRTDADLQACHTAHLWIVTFDDHEMENNWAGVFPEWKDPQPDFRARRSAALQAYYENMPPASFFSAHRGRHQHASQLPYGNLLQFTVLDTRQFRSRQPCGDDFKPTCGARLSPEATMMGDDQEKWFAQTLGESSARWNIIANQVMIAQLKMPSTGSTTLFNMDQWDGYPATRKRLTDFLAARRPNNPVFITGDFHQTWVGNLKENFDDPGSQTVATELVGTSITSGGDGSPLGPHAEQDLNANPHLIYNNDKRGYFLCEAKPGALTSRACIVSMNEASAARADTALHAPAFLVSATGK